MKAMTYNGPDSCAWSEVPDPVIQHPEDAVIRVDAVTICGTDLHILKGDVPRVERGRILGHEAVGVVEEVGAAVTGLEIGDRVLISCISSCGACEYCLRGRYGQCLGGGGWILGHTIDGTQAEKVRVPFARRSTHKLSDQITDERALMLADIFPTSYEVGVINGKVSPGNTVVIVGAGPIGLAAITASRLMSPLKIVVVDPAESRRRAARLMGATVTLDPADDVQTLVMGLTDGLGADVVLEAVGTPETFELCTRLLRPGGTVANIGVHGSAVTLHLEDLWIKDITITTGLVDTSSTPLLLKLLDEGVLDVDGLITHRFGFEEFEQAYDVFSRPAETSALKVAVLSPESLQCSS